MVLNEVLCLWLIVFVFFLYVKEDMVFGGEYFLEKGDELMVLIFQFYCDKIIWGDDVEEFCSECFENLSVILQYVFKLFGNGQCVCIGQQFVFYEVMLVFGMMLKYFDFEDYINYELDIKEILMLKFEGFVVKVKLKKILFGGIFLFSIEQFVKKVCKKVENVYNMLLFVLYGLNMGIVEGMVCDLVDIVMSKGFVLQVVMFDLYVGNFLCEGVVLIVMVFYNGYLFDNVK